MGNLVVVGVDGSSSSLAAVEEAAREAQRRRAELRVVHAFSWPVRPVYTPLGDPYTPPDPSPLNRLVNEAAQHARNVAPEVGVTEAVVTGDAVAVLEAESRAADLVVVGPRGMGGFIGMLLGSTAASLAAHSRCPVMVVREEPAGTGPIVLAVDGSSVGEKAVEFAFAEAALRGAEIVAAHAWLPDYAPAGTGPESAERLLAQALAGRTERYPDVTVRHEVLSGETRETLIEASRNAQLLVVGARGRGGFAGLLLGSVSQALLHHAHCPVTVVRGTA
ncbi:universal stress protein [Streptomyces sp. NBC_01724]|uniref:universal stress protein n=1 Tax=unclassified Streptomyces TaxID=2593676 RepID=UPI002E33BF46|nr:universal stress protein [Streptomyces sp. NBC_01724]WTE55027.1 universal stress protein [Streptomyces sp. NBC_01620]WTE63102.1 universal stress protein [Streptomyces sp. NBC_01617]